MYCCDCRYLNPNVDPDSIVRNFNGDTFYDGSEMVFAGKMTSNNTSEPMETVINGQGAAGAYQRVQTLQSTGPFPDLVPGMDLVDTTNKK